MKKLIFFFSIPLVAALLLVVSLHFLSSSVNEVGAFANIGDVTISFIAGVLKGLGGRGGGFESTTTVNTPPPPPPPSPPRSGPISVPDFSTCRPGSFPERIIPMNCCPPVNTSPAVDFTLLPKSRNLRVRRALHLLDDEYMAKFTRAFQLMRELPDDDPRSFIQQASVHCAYCLGGHAHVGFPDKLLEVHISWLFFPWHRMYMYFFERILGKLINDPTFALPYWNWDSPEGMHIPESFADKNSPFYQELRNEKHLPPATLDLNYDFAATDSSASEEEMKMVNLAVMYRQVISAGMTPELFHGKPYHPGDEPRVGRGSFELIPHGMIHKWIGDSRLPEWEAMGTAYISARDPLFYVHHSNVDRIWTIRKAMPGGNNTDFSDPDWLNSEFMFYDEEARLVKMKVKDCLDLEKLGYTFDDAGVAPPWANAKPTPRGRDKSKKYKKTTTTTTISATNMSFPVKLNKVVRFVVPRKPQKPEMDVNNKEEVLVIQMGIKVNRNNNKIIKFDVIINDDGDEEGIGPTNTEFAGSYWSISTTHEDALTLGGISELLQGLGAQHDESVVVTLVPRFDIGAGTSVTIDGVKFDYV